MHVNVRSVGVGMVRVCMMCVGNSEQRERGVGASVNNAFRNTIGRRARRSCPKGGTVAKKNHELVCMR